MGWLRHRVLLPGMSVLARPVSTVREAAADRLYRTLAEAAQAADPQLSGRLRASLEVPEGRRLSELERHRRTPTRTSGPEMSRAERVAKLAEPRRTATLLAATRQLEAAAVDDAWTCTRC